MSSGRIVSLLYQPPAMRWRGVTVLTNTPPRVSQSAPGGMQGIAIMEPMLAKAARKLGDRSGGDPQHQRARGQGRSSARRFAAKRPYVTSAFHQEALDRGAEQFKWDERKKHSPSAAAPRCAASAFRSALCRRLDRLRRPVRHQAGRHACTSSPASAIWAPNRCTTCTAWRPRCWACRGRKCEITLGQHAKNLPWTCPSGGSQTTHAMTRAAYVAATEANQKLQEIAAKDLGGKPEDYEVANERVFRKGGGAGHDPGAGRASAPSNSAAYTTATNCPKGINKMTGDFGYGAGRAGLAGRGRDTMPHDGQTHSFVAGFAEVEVDLETGKYSIIDYLGVADVGTVIHPRALGGQVLGRSTLGIGHAIGQKWVYDQHYGCRWPSASTTTSRRRSWTFRSDMEWDAVEHSRSGNAGRRARHRRAAGRRRMHGDCERAFRRAGRRSLPPRAGNGGHDSGFARSGQARMEEGLTAHI